MNNDLNGFNNMESRSDDEQELVTQAVSLFESGDISIGKAAKLAGMNLAAFAEYVSHLGIPVVNYHPDELDDELAFLSS